MYQSDCRDLSQMITNQGGTMKLDVEDNNFITYLMLGMMALGFVVMLLV